MAVAPQLDQQEPSPLATARLQRKLTVDEAAHRAGLSPEQLQWLEEGRVYRFPSADDALVAVVLYASALGIDQDEARSLARLPVEPRPPRYPRTRIISAAAGLALLAALGVALLGELRLQLRRHAFGHRLPDEAPECLLEAIALPAIGAQVEVLLRLRALLVAQLAVEERLQQLLAPLARIFGESAHAASPPSTTARSASSRFRIRRPRCRRDITVPTGMSRIWAASL